MQRKNRNLERIWILAISLVMGFLFVELFKVLEKDFQEVDQRLGSLNMVDLNADQPGERMKELLTRGFYFDDPRDIDLVANTVSQRIHLGEDVIDNIGELNKSKYNINADDAFNAGGNSFKKRVQLSRSLLGYTGDDSVRFEQEMRSPPPLPSVHHSGLGESVIGGQISNRDGNAVQGVLVRLQMVVPQDSTYSDEVSEVEKQLIESGPGDRKIFAVDSAGHKQLISFSAYARTDGSGKFQFTGLLRERTYEVLPLQPNYQFGSSKGVSSLEKNANFQFTQSPHTIRLLSTKDFNNLKKERSLIVRTPAEAQKWYWMIMAVFIAGFILIHILLSFVFSRSDQMILPVLMFLIGLSLLTLLSLQDPLRDRFLARSTLWYLVGGFAGIMVIMFFDLKKFTTDSALYSLFIFHGRSASKGIQWAGLAILLLFLTILMGSGPEGSGVKVNLFGFQPSEVVKFLVVIFLAGFFAMNEKFISEYASMQKRWSFFYFALAAILISILLFLMLGDLGPAIVVCFTFIILFSFSRGDFAYMTASVVLFVLVAWIVKNFWIASAITITILGLYMWFSKKVSESSIMALVVMMGFMLLDQVPYLDQVFPGPVQRLAERKSIWLDKWDNEVFGGDQIANGIWAMSSGGITGQGVGEGFAKTIPEAHTDMILPAIGEEFGWAGIVCVFILFLVFLHRSMIIGRQSGRPFLFYLCTGIGVATFVQFLLIAGGSIGALPLSGVSLPFVSYGGSSLITNMIAAGFLLSASLVRGSVVQMNYISKQQDRNLVPALMAALIGLILLSVNVGRYLFNNSTWVVQPALVADRSGARMFSYNPRIAILINRLQAGSLFDRKGKLLATSNPQLVMRHRDSLAASGLDASTLESLSRKRLDRYYPFAEHMFFWTGDANTGVFTGGTNGYFAEYQHDAELRGFETPVTGYMVSASRFRERRFLPGTRVEMAVAKKDYSALAPLLLAGINSAEVEAFKKRNRDVQLSMDAELQTRIQADFAKDDSLADNRVSVVIIEDNTGDVIASAGYPLPPINDWERLTMPIGEQNRLSSWTANTDLGFTHATQPGSTAKVATTLAAFNKLGMAAAQKNIQVRPQDLIRVKGFEPDEAGNISLERALVRSNNSYFIRLANEEQLQEQMAEIYIRTGMFLRGAGGYHYGRSQASMAREEQWWEMWRNTEFRSLRSYNRNDIRRTRGRGVSGMAWGQGELIASPAAMARLAAGVANNGMLVPHRFVLRVSDSVMAVKEGVAIAGDPEYAATVKKYMIRQSAGKVKDLRISVGGKTGTPERIWKGERINDGWYVFFAPKAEGPGHVVVCVRMEKAKGSSEAVKLAGKHIIPKLLERGYIKGFEPEAATRTLQ
jgi:cell division protein FtsW (lipid II flippase)